MICCVCWGLYTLVYPQHMHNVHYFAVYTSVHKPRALARTLRRGILSKDKQHAPRNDASLPSRQMSGEHMQENKVISPTQAQKQLQRSQIPDRTCFLKLLWIETSHLKLFWNGIVMAHLHLFLGLSDVSRRQRFIGSDQTNCFLWSQNQTISHGDTGKIEQSEVHHISVKCDISSTTYQATIVADITIGFT